MTRSPMRARGMRIAVVVALLVAALPIGLTATAGGAGVLTGPLFMGAGLTGATYVGTIALGAVALHLGRVLGYGAGGLFAAELIAPMAILAVGLIGGNFAGKGLRRHITDKLESRVEIGALVVCTTFAVVGLGT